jgi:hypothetical protein
MTSDVSTALVLAATAADDDGDDINLAALTREGRARLAAQAAVRRRRNATYDEAIKEVRVVKDVIGVWLARADVVRVCVLRAMRGSCTAAFALCNCSTNAGTVLPSCTVCGNTMRGELLLPAIVALLAARGMAADCEVQLTLSGCSNRDWDSFSREYTGTSHYDPRWIVVSWRRSTDAEPKAEPKDA